ncbi:hypothetical protein [Niveibacterium terrae]|uniref:hypothetical protein n=1 Tax=Niveibacterium terrae TaxID=3373598 RepID=UPI003A8E9BD0
MLACRAILLCVTTVLLWSNIATAQEYDWAIAKIPSHKEINDWNPVVGKIDGQQYLAIQLDTADKGQGDFRPVLVFARIKEGGTYEPLAAWRIENLNLDLTVEIKNNSIYVRHDTAHHGVHSSTYQFKRRAETFQLVGIERDSTTNDYNEKTQRQFSVRSRESLNLITAKAIISTQRTEMFATRENKKFAQKTVPVSELPPIQLKQFDPYNFNGDLLCHHFDDNLRLINSCKK